MYIFLFMFDRNSFDAVWVFLIWLKQTFIQIQNRDFKKIYNSRSFDAVWVFLIWLKQTFIQLLNKDLFFKYNTKFMSTSTCLEVLGHMHPFKHMLIFFIKIFHFLKILFFTPSF